MMFGRESTGSPIGITPLQQIVASCSGALITSLFMTPLDVVKIRLQAQKTPFAKGNCFVYCNGLMDHLCVCLNGNGKAWYKRSPANLTGTRDAFIKIVQHEGAKSLWSGLPPTLIMAVPTTVIYFTTYEWLKDGLMWQLDSRHPSICMLAGAMARVGAVTVISPLELIRTKMQSQQLTYKQLGACVKQAVAQGGWRSFWQGWSPTMFRDVPFSGIYWMNLELIKRWIVKHYAVREQAFFVNFTAGAISGMLAATLTLPFDVVKTQRQVALGKVVIGAATPNHESTWSVMRDIYRRAGPSGLFAGFLPRVAKVAPACAIMIGCYECVKDFFRQLNHQKMLALPRMDG
uniref:mitochondrial glutathione transporter SLC25A40-like isoform X1 n=1 Tax=Myxine glutinosa TaxID=7769 RepID=UPI00358FAD55